MATLKCRLALIETKLMPKNPPTIALGLACRTPRYSQTVQTKQHPDRRFVLFPNMDWRAK